MASAQWCWGHFLSTIYLFPAETGQTSLPTFRYFQPPSQGIMHIVRKKTAKTFALTLTLSNFASVNR